MNDMARIATVVADITTLDVDAIVNAANEKLAGGGGVDGAIHAAAGPELKAACRAIGYCPPGEAVVTPGFRLKARHVIHTVGPIWRGGTAHEERTLRDCYENSLTIAKDRLLNTIAFPAISTGIYGFPFEQATEVAVETVMAFLGTHSMPHRVIFCCFDNEAAEHYRRVITRRAGELAEG